MCLLSKWTTEQSIFIDWHIQLNDVLHFYSVDYIEYVSIDAQSQIDR